MNKRQRTVAEVQEAQSRSAAGGCCDRFADNQGCDCLAEAQRYEALESAMFPGSRPAARDGPYPQVHPRSEAVQNAEGELGQFLVGWAHRHGLTRAEYLMLLSREFARDLGRAVAMERRDQK